MGQIVSGTASMNRRPDRMTHFDLSVKGLLANTAYTAHVHSQPCAMTEGGPHYKRDLAIATVIEANEIWLRFTSDAAGLAAASIDVDHLTRADARSIVIHEPVSGGRLACVDLY
jgi:hypothetical protein